jgi:hypothetical protein
MSRIRLLALLLGLILIGCTDAMPGDSIGGQSRPRVPMIPIPQTEGTQAETEEVESEPVQERHGVTTRQACREMADRFKRQGRQVELVEVKASDNPGATLKFTCIFEGKDAQEGWFEDSRF